MTPSDDYDPTQLQSGTSQTIKLFDVYALDIIRNKITRGFCLVSFLIHSGTQNTKNKHKFGIISTGEQFLQASSSCSGEKFKKLSCKLLGRITSSRMVPVSSSKLNWHRQREDSCVFLTTLVLSHRTHFSYIFPKTSNPPRSSGIEIKRIKTCNDGICRESVKPFSRHEDTLKFFFNLVQLVQSPR